MMKKMLIAALGSLPLLANAGGFAGLDFVSSKIEPDNTNASAKPSALQFKFGSWINKDETLGGEVRLGLGVGDDELTRNADLEIDRSYGAYFRGQFPNTLPVRPYGLLGLTYVETTVEFDNGGSDGENFKDLSLGLGVDVTVTNNIFVSLEYMRVVDRSGDEVSNLALGLNGRF
ncbi:outer membrane beta-barrel protein [Alcanivorax sediminis]|uniref:Outer membrane beta-barrel protein n=1 Tax=Alcanivorax sediminis TaxID=2663008 RepID=A0A6N7LRP8_9GAMM|nr:outer membrane beta-barrel protein [Alcanivorax sediminis]MQX52933.1 outer membrane beta-barrel protein [Alcanivorax sediminis]